MNRIEEILDKVPKILEAKNFIGIGSTRKVFKCENVVIKKHLHKLGHLQSINEQDVYAALSKKNLTSFLAPILYADENMAIQEYYQSVALKSGETYDIDLGQDERLTADLRKAIEEIDKNHDGFDLRDSGNYGLDQSGKLILIDYGMTKKLYEDEWVPLATAGVLPQIYFEKCQVCGQDKELRIYGENDADRRCVECGKE